MRRTFIAAASMIAVISGVSAMAAPSGEDAAKYRQAVMRAIGGHFGAASLIVRAGAGGPEQLSQHVEALQNLAAEVDSIFPAGSMVEDSHALPAVWENPDAFAGAVEKLQAEVAKLDEAVSGGDDQAISDAQRALGLACRGCHEDYRHRDE